jgi:uncharacterized protein YqjF (DUF2071 family)
MSDRTRPFLTAAWRHLVMLNYAVSPSLLRPLVPAGTTLDSFHDTYYASVIGFLFLDTRVLGIPIPNHRNFEEVNLRFYVRRDVDGETRRAVTFVREFVPRRAIAAVAHAAYNEPYTAVPMRHDVSLSTNGDPRRVQFSWRTDHSWTTVAAEAEGAGMVPPADSFESFIAEHYWGYTRQKDGGTVEYEVRHPPWRVWKARDATLTGAVAQSYGPAWAAALAAEPSSAFIADGSPVTVYTPRRIG